MCRALAVSRRGYSDGVKRPPRAHAQQDQELSARIVDYVEANRHLYGPRRLKDC